jgi:hypothetical protein
MKSMAKRMIVAAAAGLSLALAYADLAFRWDGPLGRVITPNGDGRNDKAIFCFENPADSDVSGTIYTMLGSQVANLQPRQGVPAGSACPAGTSGLPNKVQMVIWDPAAQGQVQSGVYVYQIRSEGKAFSGTIVVVR